MRFKDFLLLEYNEDKNWANHGAKISELLKSQGVESNHREFWDKQIKDHDPTPNKEYAGWISQKYASGGINHHEDIASRVGPALKTYHKYKLKKALETHGVPKDIGAIKNITHLEDSVDRLPKEEEETKSVSSSEVTKHDEEHWKVYTPHTEEASKKYGAGTRWCTAGHSYNMFHNYNKQGPLHIYVPKNPKHPGEKYQAHRETMSFMDEKDRPVNMAATFKDRPSPHAKEHSEVTSKYISDKIKDPDSTDVLNRHLFNHHNFNGDHITQLLTTDHHHFGLHNYGSDAVSRMMGSEHFSDEKHLPIAIKHIRPGIRSAAYNKPGIKPEHIDYALEHETDQYVLRNAIVNRNATTKHLDRALKDNNPNIRQAALMNPKATTKHIDKGLTDPDEYNRSTALQNPNVESKHITKGLDDPNQYVREVAASHPKADSSHIDKAIKDKSSNVRYHAVWMNNHKLTSDHIDNALKDENKSVKLAALANPNATSHHLMKALDDEDSDVRIKAINHKNAGSEHFTKALSKDDQELQYKAVRRSGLSPEHINKALDSKYHDVRRLAAQHIDATPENLTKAMSDPDKHVRINALRHMNSNTQHINMGLNDSDPEVQGHASFVKKYKEE